MLRILADNVKSAVAPDYLAVAADFLDRSPDFHKI